MSRMSSVQRAQTHPERTRRRSPRGPLSACLRLDLPRSSALAEGRTNISPSWRATGPPAPNGHICTLRMHLQCRRNSVTIKVKHTDRKCVVSAFYHWGSQVCCRKVLGSLPVEPVCVEPKVEQGEADVVFICNKMSIPPLVN